MRYVELDALKAVGVGRHRRGLHDKLPETLTSQPYQQRPRIRRRAVLQDARQTTMSVISAERVHVAVDGAHRLIADVGAGIRRRRRPHVRTDVVRLARRVIRAARPPAAHQNGRVVPDGRNAGQLTRGNAGREDIRLVRRDVQRGEDAV